MEIVAGRHPGTRAPGDLVDPEAEVLGQAGGEDAVGFVLAEDGRREESDRFGGGLDEAEKEAGFAGKAQGDGHGGDDREGEQGEAEADEGGPADGRARGPGRTSRIAGEAGFGADAGDGLGHLAGRGEPLGDVLGQGPFEDADAAVRCSGREGREGLRVAVDDSVGQRVLVRAVERKRPGQHLVEDDAEGPDVGAGVDVLAAELFGRHVGDGADGPALAGQAGLSRDLGQPEVGHPGDAFLGDEDVGRLDVPVDDAVGVGGGQAVGDLRGEREGLGGGERAALDLGPEALAVAKGHGDEHAPVLALPDLVDGADVGIVEDRGRLGLVDEALAGLVVVGQLEGQELEGHGAPQLDVVGLVDDAHAAAADLAEDTVLARDDSSGQEAAGDRVDGRGQGGRAGGRFGRGRRAGRERRRGLGRAGVGAGVGLRASGRGGGGAAGGDERRGAQSAEARRVRIHGLALRAIDGGQ